MSESRVHTEINRLLESLDGELTSRSRVVDALLDVRCATTDAPLIAMVDDALRNVPGRNCAETAWLRNQLITLGVMSDLGFATTPGTAVV